METYTEPKCCTICGDTELSRVNIVYDFETFELESYDIICENCTNKVAQFDSEDMSYIYTI